MAAEILWPTCLGVALDMIADMIDDMIVIDVDNLVITAHCTQTREYCPTCGQNRTTHYSKQTGPLLN